MTTVTVTPKGEREFKLLRIEEDMAYVTPCFPFGDEDGPRWVDMKHVRQVEPTKVELRITVEVCETCWMQAASVDLKDVTADVEKYIVEQLTELPLIAEADATVEVR